MTGKNPIDGGGTKAFPGGLEKSGELFEDLVTRAMSPSSKMADTNPNGFQPEVKGSGSSASGSNKERPKKPGDTSNTGANKSVSHETIVSVIVAENVPIQAVAPAMETTDKTIGPVTEPVLATNPGENFIGLPGDKIISADSAKAPHNVVSKNQPETGQVSETKNGAQEKFTAAVKTLAAEKAFFPDPKTLTTCVSSMQASEPAKSPAPDSPASMLPDKSAAQSPQSGLSASPKFQETAAPQSEPQIIGTSVALQDAPMKKAGNFSETAMPAGKNLPGAAVSVTTRGNLPAGQNTPSQISATIMGNSSLPDSTNNAIEPSADLIAGAASTDLRSRTLDRVQDMVLLHSTRLGDSGNDSLQVVLKPGAGTQLSLELRQRGDGVEAQAVLQRGDFGHLNQQWPALQQQLEQRGIRLAPLADDVNFASGEGSRNSQDKQNQPDDSNLFPAGALAEIAPSGLPVQMAAGTGTSRGWQSWA